MPTRPLSLLSCAAALLWLVQPANTTTAAEDVVVSEAQVEDGVRVHTVRSPYQRGVTEIRVLLPSTPQPDTGWPVLYVLPVEAGNGTRWGDALAEVRRHRLHQKHGLICVYPTFSHLPWYADHPTDSEIRQETYFLKVVVPFVERTYPALAKPEGRLLVGFSKSGWGAFSLLLRHPNRFARAAAWDAPLTMQKPNRFGTRPIFGTQANFEAYRLTRLVEKQAESFQDEPRLIHLGYGTFRDHHRAFEARLEQLGIARVYRDGPQRKHHWTSGWLPEALRLLVDDEGAR